jgi:cell pole-organizing protein PopZ
MANPSAAHEPSMEEILASIRQIISEDGEEAAKPEAKAAAQPAPTATEDEPDELAEASPPQSPPAYGASMRPQKAESPITSASPIEEETRRTDFAPAATSRPATASSPAPRPAEPTRNLLSADSDAAVSGAFSALAHTILAQNARTLEDLVVEMLRPMLHDWLEDNLPSLVERLVSEEIQRVSRGRR